jgi:RNA polymerase sigma-70 factor (ECF subfamily)
LVEDCLAGNQSAMRELVERYQAQVFGLCFRMLGNRQDAEDAAQETFVRALRSLSRWDSRRDFEPWLWAIAGNRCRTALAKRRRRPVVQPLRDPAASAHETWERDQLAEEVARGLALLRPEYSQAFVLFHENEMSYDQIAQAVGRPLGTVKTWIHRARRELIGYLIRRGVVVEPAHAMRSF